MVYLVDHCWKIRIISSSCFIESVIFLSDSGLPPFFPSFCMCFQTEFLGKWEKVKKYTVLLLKIPWFYYFLVKAESKYLIWRVKLFFSERCPRCEEGDNAANSGLKTSYEGDHAINNRALKTTSGKNNTIFLDQSFK